MAVKEKKKTDLVFLKIENSLHRYSVWTPSDYRRYEGGGRGAHSTQLNGSKVSITQVAKAERSKPKFQVDG